MEIPVHFDYFSLFQAGYSLNYNLKLLNPSVYLCVEIDQGFASNVERAVEIVNAHVLYLPFGYILLLCVPCYRTRSTLDLLYILDCDALISFN